MSAAYLPPDAAPTRDELQAMPGLVVLEFGTDWCGHCRALSPELERALAAHQGVRHIKHIKVEDGPGRPLGRAFRVKLWPNLVFLRDGKPLRQLARPDRRALEDAFAALDRA